MRWPLLHPSFRRLDAYAHDELGPRQRERVAGHIRDCPRCFEWLRFSRELSRQLRDMHVEPPGDAVWRRIQDSLASGASVLVPADVPIPLDVRRPRWRAVGAAAAVLVAAAATLVLVVPGLDAHHESLVLSDPAHQPGDPLRVTYRRGVDIPSVAGQLRLRMRLHGEDGRVETSAVALSPGRRDHEANLTLPDWVVYAAFAVEDSTGTWVDSNHGRLWELLAHDAHGRPRFEAFRAKAAHHLRTDLLATLESARAMAEHYPHRAEAWGMLYAVERLTLDRERLDSVTTLHGQRFSILERQFGSRRLPPEELAAMTLYAGSLGDAVAAERWTERLLREAPHVRLAVQLRTQQLERDHGHEPSRLLERFDSLWEDVGPQRDIAAAALALAHRSAAGSAALLWADRLLGLDPTAGVAAAERLSTLPEVRRVGIRRLRSELRRIEEGALDPEARPLERSVREQRALTERTRQRLLIALGNALMAEGELDAALDALLLASDLTWEPRVFRTTADGLARAGDSVAAIPLLARVAADPTTAAEEGRSLAAMAEQHVTRWEWQDQVEQARQRMQRQVLSEAVRGTLPPRILAEREGRAVDLRVALKGNVAVVSLWQCLCPQFTVGLARHAALVEELASAGVPLVTVLTGRGPAPWASPDEEHVRGLQFLADPDGEVLRAFGHGRTPAYFIVDAEGYVRYRYASPDDVVRQASVLREAARSVVVQR